MKNYVEPIAPADIRTAYACLLHEPGIADIPADIRKENFGTLVKYCPTVAIDPPIAAQVILHWHYQTLNRRGSKYRFIPSPHPSDIEQLLRIQLRIQDLGLPEMSRADLETWLDGIDPEEI